MADSPKRKQYNLSADELASLNDEIVALVRAGVPLGKGLLHLRGDLRGRLGKFAEELGHRIESGVALDDALTRQNGPLGASYSAVVSAGVRSTRLPAALEAVSQSLRRVAGLRRNITGALIYPICIALLAYGLLALSVWRVIPPVVSAYQSWNFPLPWPVTAATSLSSSIAVWVWWPPLFGLAFALGCYFLLPTWLMRSSSWFTRVPTPGAIAQLGQWAIFCDTLALLLEHHVPLTEGVPLAASVVGDRSFQRHGESFSAALLAGNRSLSQQATPRGLPTFIVWLMLNSSDTQQIARSLRRHASTLHWQANQHVRRLQTHLPVLMSLVLGGGAVLGYALIVWYPWLHMLVRLSQPQNT